VLAIGVFLLTRIGVLLFGTFILFDYLREIRLPVSIDRQNSDGHYGLAEFRRLLEDIVLLGIFGLLSTSIILFIWIGPDSLTIALGIIAVLIAILLLAVPMTLISEGIRVGKKTELTEIQNKLTTIENRMLHVSASWASSSRSRRATDDPLIVSYWQSLREEHEKILDIPSTGFRYREFAYSVITMLVVPSVLLIIGAVLGTPLVAPT
jgi:hypothetical protein